jgi:hypothetical protein
MLLINWKRDSQCNIKFDELFESIPPGVRILPYVIEPLASSSSSSSSSSSILNYIQKIANDYDLTSIIMDDTW